MPKKIIWATGYQDINAFMTRLQQVSADSVAIWTKYPATVTQLLQRCQPLNIPVLGWRWPATTTTWIDAEVAQASQFFQAGLAGYIMDPEEELDAAKAEINWNQKGLDAQASYLCQQLRAIANGKPIMMTSGLKAADSWPALPWQAFVQNVDACLPQAYWKCEDGVILPGTPGANYLLALACWQKLNPACPIIPMGGDIVYGTPAQITAYGVAAAASNIDTLHFYAEDADNPLSDAMWSAIENI